MTEAELAATLVEVRRASRLLVAYQQRINEVFFRVHRALEGRGISFRWWASDRHRTPSRSTTVQFAPGKWPWDLFPGLSLAAEWSSEGPGPVRRVYMALDTDTGFQKTGDRSAPDPSRFRPVEDCDTRLRVGLYTANRPGVSWVAVRTGPLRDRWPEGEHREISWELEPWSGSYAYLVAPVQRFVSSDAIDQHLVHRITAWADRHAPPEPTP